MSLLLFRVTLDFETRMVLINNDEKKMKCSVFHIFCYVTFAFKLLVLFCIFFFKKRTSVLIITCLRVFFSSNFY